MSVRYLVVFLNYSGHCLEGCGVDSFDKKSDLDHFNQLHHFLPVAIFQRFLIKQNQNSDPRWRVKELEYSKNLITPMILIYSDSDFHL